MLDLAALEIYLASRLQVLRVIFPARGHAVLRSALIRSLRVLADGTCPDVDAKLTRAQWLEGVSCGVCVCSRVAPLPEVLFYPCHKSAWSTPWGPNPALPFARQAVRESARLSLSSRAQFSRQSFRESWQLWRS